MKKQLPLIFTACLAAILFGAWLRARMSVPFTGFEGHYECGGGFGLPEPAFNVMRFQSEGDRVVIDALNKSQTWRVGMLEIKSSSLARLDLDSSLMHAPTLPLNPLAEHFIEGKRNTIQIVGRQEGKELYRFSCSQVPLGR